MSTPQASPRTRGAETSRQAPWEAYLAHHRESAQTSLRDQLAHPWATLLTALAMAIALALPALMAVGLGNIGALTQALDSTRQATLYFAEPPDDATVLQLRTRLQKDADVQSVVYVSPEKALELFRAYSEAADLLAGLDSNPLPASLQITLRPETPLDRLRALKAGWQAIPGVESVQLDTVWLERLHAFESLASTGFGLLAVLLGLAVVLFMGNTIRLAIENRRDEILVARLVGATDAWVRRPFLYLGAGYGLWGGLLAVVLVHACLLALSDSVAQLSAAYASDFSLVWPGFSGSLLILLTGVVLGWAGAWLTVLRQLQDVEPR
ncbi:permease-like cell division protein FtsX [Hahella sp. SMD15-11]|uniref:Cell division protein FtsX n=1 Tax=Thermohahella caldifontis TaxID=3142973 RepID=A0AB39UUA5_9GAMM